GIMLGKLTALLTVGFFLVSCGPTEITSDLKLRRLTRGEAMADLNEIVAKVKTLYGPLKFKEERFGYTFDDLVAKARADIQSSNSDNEVFGAYQRFLAAFEDGHVGIRFTDNNDPVAKIQIPIFTTPIEGKAIVAKVAEELV